MTNHETEPVCKFEQGCHRVAPCDPGCAAPAAVSVPPPAPQAADRRARYAAAIAEGFRAFDADTTSDAYLDAELLDAVVAVADAEEAELLAAVPVVPPATLQTAEEHRLALSEALGLGTGAPWDAIHDRVTELGLPPLGRDPVARRLGLLAAYRATILTEGADAVFALDYDVMVGEEGDENLGSMREAWDLGTIHAEKLLRRLADEAQGAAEYSRALVTPPSAEAAAYIRERLADEVGDDHSCAESGCSGEPGPCVAGEQQNETPEAEAQPFTVQVWPLARVLAEVRCGSEDWSWDEEWADLDRRHAETGYLAKLEQQIRANGITMPVLIGTDGRLWDGHHRLRIAVRLGIDYVPVEVPAVVAQPGKEA